MSSAIVWFTLAALFSLCVARSFQPGAVNWVRHWEQERPLARHADEAKDTVRRFLKRIDQKLSDDTQCGYQACSSSSSISEIGLLRANFLLG